ncbi:CaiB/BaiF CoA transferase family protein [Rhodococcus opacus]|uniref:CaiB/BaiF CoA transferase family protein n=1 Tax=Rhodococcus opacus TaxID=37919 RepID=UPI001C464294|nr:CaiB/BaiF CoA-transferase family protein [Rhodococcus opacus]MBV6756683.1 CoA transferase [Rhodococcus opacus]
MPGPLTGIRVIELAGLGPGPFACMLLADLGADVIRIERPGGSTLPAAAPEADLMNRGKRSVIIDLKHPGGVDAVLRLASTADVFVEGFRPGVAERLGVGPEAVHELNPRIVYGRMTGWGQDGPIASTAGHDINYIAVTGALHAIGSTDGPPQIPANFLGDFGGGATYLVIGVLAALVEADRTGSGQVIDASIVDGTTHLLTLAHTMLGSGQWKDRRGVNLTDGGRPYYAVYRTRDEQYMAVGAIEPQFYRELLRILAIPTDEVDPLHQEDPSTWPHTTKRLTEEFATRTQTDWIQVFAGSDACVSPILSLRQAGEHPQLLARRVLTRVSDDLLQPAVAPRFSRHPRIEPGVPAAIGADTVDVLREVGLDAARLIADGAAMSTE